MSKLLHEAAAKILFTRATNGQAIFMGQAIKAVPKVKEKYSFFKIKKRNILSTIDNNSVKNGK